MSESNGSEWKRQCVVCASRGGRQTKLDAGHCCPSCAVRIGDDLASIVRYGDMAAVDRRTGGGSTSGTSYESKPPTGLESVAPYLTLVNIGDRSEPVRRRVSYVLGQWERMLREHRGYVPYGPATAHHIGTDEGILAAQSVRQSVAILRGNLDWIVAETTWPLDDFADEIARCASTMRTRVIDDEPGTMVKCPTLTEGQDDDGNARTCGYRLYYLDMAEHVTCKRCKVTRDAWTLVAVAMSDGREVWLDPEAAAQWLGIAERTLYRMANRGEIRRAHGRYLVRHAG